MVVKAVVVAIAHPRLGDAVAGARTRELEVGARLFSAKVALVAAVSAIVFRVALPRRRHAPAVLALELR